MLSRKGRYLVLASAKTSRQQAALATASGRWWRRRRCQTVRRFIRHSFAFIGAHSRLKTIRGSEALCFTVLFVSHSWKIVERVRIDLALFAATSTLSFHKHKRNLPPLAHA